MTISPTLDLYIFPWSSSIHRGVIVLPGRKPNTIQAAPWEPGPDGQEYHTAPASILIECLSGGKRSGQFLHLRLGRGTAEVKGSPLSTTTQREVCDCLKVLKGSVGVMVECLFFLCFTIDLQAARCSLSSQMKVWRRRMGR